MSELKTKVDAAREAARSMTALNASLMCGVATERALHQGDAPVPAVEQVAAV